jgi:hypothetical protein
MRCGGLMKSSTAPGLELPAELKAEVRIRMQI